MKLRMKKLLLAIPIFPLLISSCQVSNQGSNTVFVSGEIVNPNDEFVVLYQGDEVIDSARLDARNRFTFILPELNDGLYHFYHSPEQQYIYLEQGDSLRIRLNTKDFDESLSFSGQGSSLNNFLISMFLEYEKEAEEISDYYGLNPEEFLQTVDELRNKKLQDLQEIAVTEDWSPAAVRMARAAIDFDNYIYREKYPFYHRRSAKEYKLHELPDDFYAYRNDLNINNRELSFFRPYYEFMKYHIGNISYMSCLEHCNEESRRESAALHLGKHKMRLIDSIVAEPSLRNNLLRNVAMDYLLQNPRITALERSFYDEFNQLSTNESHKMEITFLFQGINDLQANNPFPEEIKVLNQFDEKVTLREETFTQPVVVYFWTANQKGHLQAITDRVNQLRESHSEFKYLGIALRTDPQEWREAIKEHGLEPSEQFLGYDFETLRNKLVIESLNKCVVVKDGRIVEAFANIYYPLPSTKKRTASPSINIPTTATVVE